MGREFSGMSEPRQGIRSAKEKNPFSVLVALNGFC